MPNKITIPSMPSCTGCGDCCGPVAATPKEIKKIAHKVKKKRIKWIPHALDPAKCGFFRFSDDGKSGSCTIYSVRPWSCQAFGVLKEMPCDFFPEAVRISIPADEAVKRRLLPPYSESALLSSHFAPDHGDRQINALRLKKQQDMDNIMLREVSR
ncbi:hypothetical protein LCGC14_1474210 [marine sediment metagenome]|uniref:YkgJ family cysteine cluster protein n=1 Tax=marine sediment metagenome TaxID=412755 RepID=A0A0F9JBE9_9ZZZZ